MGITYILDLERKPQQMTLSRFKRIASALMASAFLISLLSSCSKAPTSAGSDSSKEIGAKAAMRTITDAMGNVVEVPANLSKIAVTPLPWSSVVYAIDGTSEHMISINPGAMAAYKGRFFEKLDTAYGSLDTTSIGSDFSINMEEMARRGIEAVVIWDYQTDEAEQLKALGIVPVMVKNETIEDLQASFAAVGQMLGKEERATEFNALYSEAYAYLKSFSESVATANKPKVLYLRNSELNLQGNNMFIEEALQLAGADNVAPGASSITMEEILAIDPDIIFLSNFDAFTPDDLYENRIGGQDWSKVSAVTNGRVYKTPMGIYRWDAPGVETPLMMKWLASIIQPGIFADVNMKQEIRAYFSELFGYTLTDGDIDQIFWTEANAWSAK
jgi:iron complex transport system substrate-binding protein